MSGYDTVGDDAAKMLAVKVLLTGEQIVDNRPVRHERSLAGVG